MIQGNFEKWCEILNWKVIPNFGGCLNFDTYDEFMGQYYMSEPLAQLARDFFLTLFSEYELQNVKFLGRPGCGKTHFINYLLLEAKEKHPPLLNKYSLYKFYATRATDSERDPAKIEDIVINYIKEGWKLFYFDCGKGDMFERVNQRKISNKEKCNALIDIYKQKKSEFNKIFIFIIDDADHLESDELQLVLKFFLKHLRVNLVKKWLVIRKCTYESYNAETRNLVDAHFPDRKPFPYIHLYKIILHRLKNLDQSIKAKNPFSEALCEAILERVHNGNTRSALATMKNILENTSPGNFSNATDELVIQNFIQKNSINSLLSLNVLPNLFGPENRTNNLPLTIDLLCLTQFISDEVRLFGACEECINIRYQKANLLPDNRRYKLNTVDFNFSMERLSDLGLLTSKKKYISLLSKGRLLVDYVQRSHYKDYCLNLLNEFSDDQIFIGLSSQIVNHRDIATRFTSWEFIYD